MFEEYAFNRVRSICTWGSLAVIIVAVIGAICRQAVVSLFPQGYLWCSLGPAITLLLMGFVLFKWSKREMVNGKRIRAETDEISKETMRDLIAIDTHELAESCARKNPGYSEARTLLKHIGLALASRLYTLEEAKILICQRFAFLELSYVDPSSRYITEPMNTWFLRFRYLDPKNTSVDDTREIRVIHELCIVGVQ